MKKFLSKKPVMITFIVLAVLGLAFYIGMIARPVAYDFNYKNVKTVGDTTVTTTLKVKNNEKAVQTRVTKTPSSTTEVETEVWIYVDGNIALLIGPTKTMTEAQYEERIKNIKEEKKGNAKAFEEKLEAAVKSELAFKANAFKIISGEGEDAIEFKCTGSTVFAIVGGIVEAVLITGAVLTIVFVVRKKK